MFRFYLVENDLGTHLADFLSARGLARRSNRR